MGDRDSVTLQVGDKFIGDFYGKEEWASRIEVTALTSDGDFAVVYETCRVPLFVSQVSRYQIFSNGPPVKVDLMPTRVLRSMIADGIWTRTPVAQR